MKCYVRWKNKGPWSGPYSKVFWPFDGDYEGQVEIDDVDGITESSQDYVVVPKSWTIGIDDEWIAWEGGECPVDPKTITEVVLRDNRTLTGSSSLWSWDHHAKSTDIIAYRVVEQDNRIMTRDEVLWFVTNTPGMLTKLVSGEWLFPFCHNFQMPIDQYQWCIPQHPGDYSDVHQFEVDPDGYIVGDPQGRKV